MRVDTVGIKSLFYGVCFLHWCVGKGTAPQERRVTVPSSTKNLYLDRDDGRNRCNHLPFRRNHVLFPEVYRYRSPRPIHVLTALVAASGTPPCWLWTPFSFPDAENPQSRPPSESMHVRRTRLSRPLWKRAIAHLEKFLPERAFQILSGATPLRRSLGYTVLPT